MKTARFVGLLVCLVGWIGVTGAADGSLDDGWRLALLDEAGGDVAVVLGVDGKGLLALGGAVVRRGGEPIGGYALVRIDGDGSSGDLEPGLALVGGDLSNAGELALVSIHGELWVGRPGNLTAVDATGLFITQARWDPSGDRLAITAWADGWRPWDHRRVRDRDVLAQAMDADIYVGQPGVDGWQRLTRAPGPDYNPVWSPDGTALLFNSVRTGYASFFMASVTSGQVHQLTNHDAHTGGDATPVALSDHCFWDADSDQILYETRTAGGEAQIWRMTPDGGPVYHGAFRDLTGLADGVALARPARDTGWFAITMTGGGR